MKLAEGVVRAHGASIVAFDESAVVRAGDLIQRTGRDARAAEILRRAGVYFRDADRAEPPRIVFLFSGQGSQYAGMMRVLAAENAAARAIIERADRWAATRGRGALSELMFSGREIPTELFAVQASVLCADVMAASALESLGIAPDFVTGHSFGDYAALVFAGAWSLEEALDATAIRCEAIAAAARAGGMSSIAAPLVEVRALLAASSARGLVEAANINAPDQVVVAGELDGLAEVEAMAAARRIETTRLPIPRAFHSSMMREAKEVLAARFATLRLQVPRVRYLSSVTGALENDPEAIRRSLVEQLTLPVDFVGQVGWLIGQGANFFVECGPRGVLAGLARRIAGAESSAVFVTCDDANKPGRWALARVAAALDSVTPEVVAPVGAADRGRNSLVNAEALDRGEASIAVTAKDAGAPGFAEFWSEARPYVARFVESLFARENGGLPSALAPSSSSSPSALAPSSTSALAPSSSSSPSALAPSSPSALAPFSDDTDRLAVTPFAREDHDLASALAPSSEPEVMRRFLVRAVVAEAGGFVKKFAPGTAYLMGTSARAEAIGRALSARGVRMLSSPAGAEAIGIVLDAESALAPWSLDQSAWSALRERTIAEPFRLLRAAHPHAKAIFAVTALGGALGFENTKELRPEGAALLGMLKAIRREFPSLQVQALDASPSEDPDSVARALLAELDAGSPRLEVGLLRKKRVVLALSPHLANSTGGPRPRTWIVTGGARGVTARIALELAQRDRPTLHLLGKHALPAPQERARLAALSEAALQAEKNALLQRTPKPAPLEWKARCEELDKTIEIERNLRAIAETGARVHYHAVDVADRAALSKTIAAIKAAAPIEGLIHGSGVEIAKSFDKKTDAIFEATLSSKVDGLVHLLHILEGQPLSVIAGFSSVSGRFGGHGQVDYSAANEAMARVISLYRAHHPRVAAFAVAWPAFSEVGLAARGSAKVFLERAGQSFMTPREGARHLLREIAAGAPEAEIVISDRPADLDADHAVTNDHPKPAAMLGYLIQSTGDLQTFERRLQARELFLAEHRLNQVPILPAVTMLEAFFELTKTPLQDFVIKSPIKVPEARLIRIERQNTQLTLTAHAERSDGVILEPSRVHATAQISEAPRAQPTCTLGQALGPPMDYPYGAQVVVTHGPSLQVVRDVTAHEHGGRATLLAPNPQALFNNAPKPLLPVALLDGCLQAAGLLARLRFNLTALPESIAHFHPPARAIAPGQEIRVDIAFRQQDAQGLRFDIVASDARGPLFALEGYRATSLAGAF